MPAIRVVRPAIAILAIVAMLISSPSPSQAVTPEINFSGSGWGHGVGLSQYGAKAMAADGATYQEIIHRYFPGASLVPLAGAAGASFLVTDSTPLWVGLLQNQNVVTFSIKGGGARLCFDDPEVCFRTVPAGETWRFGPNGSGSCVFRKRLPDGRFIPIADAFSCDGSVRPLSNETRLVLPYKAREYSQGTLRFRGAGTGAKLHAVLETGIESYLRGLTEVPESWPAAAIEAQVVATRSATAWHAINRGSAESFDATRRNECYCNLYDRSSDPVFRGATGEDGHPNWALAAQSTGSMVLHSVGRVALGMYSSSSGGVTENYIDVFGEPGYAHLVSVSDSAAFSDSAANPHASWRAGYNQATLPESFGFSWVHDVVVVDHNESGSARTVRIRGIKDGRPVETDFSGLEVRSTLSLRSTTFEVVVRPRFGDVLPDYPFAGEILGLSELGITSGCAVTTFCPGDTVSRGEMAAFIVRSLDLEDRSGSDIFDDDDTSGFEDQIETLHGHGITLGCAATRFCPGGSVTRAEMATFLTRAFALPASTGNPFTDDDGSFFEADIAALASSGITDGCAPNRFCPGRAVTRGEMAAFLIRALAVS